MCCQWIILLQLQSSRTLPRSRIANTKASVGPSFDWSLAGANKNRADWEASATRCCELYSIFFIGAKQARTATKVKPDNASTCEILCLRYRHCGIVPTSDGPYIFGVTAQTIFPRYIKNHGHKHCPVSPKQKAPTTCN